MSAALNQAITRILRSWTGFQLAVRLGTGGSMTPEKVEWFKQILFDHLNTTAVKKLDADDLMDWIEDILFNEFDLILEDGSVNWAAVALIRCRNWLASGETEQLEQFIASLPSESAVDAATAASSSGPVAGQSEDDDDGEVEGTQTDGTDTAIPMEEDGDDSTSKRQDTSKNPATVTDSEGWTTILPRRRP